MYRINEEKVFCDIADGQAVVIDFTTGIYYGFTPLGSEVLEKLRDGSGPEDIFAALQAAGAGESVRADLDGFIGELVRKEILAGDAAGYSAGTTAIAPRALEEGFLLAVQEFNDVQDLLLADPVHEVDVDMGWPIMKENG
ncbi:MAG: PqqD family protein [Clostridia bacterium]|nr:PqqD family protein [Clostridia bacterium]